MPGAYDRPQGPPARRRRTGPRALTPQEKYPETVPRKELVP
ncbi:hypothetical protein [Streptomyces pinistramenti]|nr:hypothetical protein [Streptomyces pinistramenti]